MSNGSCFFCVFFHSNPTVRVNITLWISLVTAPKDAAKPSRNNWLLPDYLFRQRRDNTTLQWYNKGVLEKPDGLRRLVQGWSSCNKISNNPTQIFKKFALCMSSVGDTTHPHAMFISQFKIPPQLPAICWLCFLKVVDGAYNRSTKWRLHILERRGVRSQH